VFGTERQVRDRLQRFADAGATDLCASVLGLDDDREASRLRTLDVLAALGPKMLELARDNAGGAHPYLANPDHTAVARGVLGDGPLLAPEQPVVLDTDATTARAVARAHMAGYLALPNYRNNLLRLGFTEDDVDHGGSDRLVDGVVAWGSVEAIAARVHAHRDAGADHVCIQVLGDPTSFPRAAWRALAPALT
jgi:probable F420-dependent oxidoreductase